MLITSENWRILYLVYFSFGNEVFTNFNLNLGSIWVNQDLLMRLHSHYSSLDHMVIGSSETVRAQVGSVLCFI